ncbi:MAG: HAMP domain-containing sensor histidine kinase [Planctomycetota bacterium]
MSRVPSILVIGILTSLLPVAGILWLITDDWRSEFRALEAQTMERLESRADDLASKCADRLTEHIAAAELRLNQSPESSPDVVTVDRYGLVTQLESEAFRFDATLRRGRELESQGSDSSLFAARELYASEWLSGDSSAALSGRRAELLLRIARCDVKLKRTELALRSLQRLAERADLSPQRSVPVPISAIAIAARTVPSPDWIADVTERVRKALLRRGAEFSLEALDTTRSWLSAAPTTETQRELDELIENRRQRESIWRQLPVPIDGTPVVRKNDLFLFRKRSTRDPNQDQWFATSIQLPKDLGLSGDHWHPGREAPAKTSRLIVRAVQSPELGVRLGHVILPKVEVEALRAEAERVDRTRRLTIAGLAVFCALSVAALAWILRRESELLSLRSQLVEHVAHELRTPAATLGLFSQLFEESGADDQLREEYVAMLSAESQRIGYVVENILDLSFTAKRLEYEAELIDLETMLQQIVAAFQPRCQADGVVLSWSAEGLPPLKGYRRGVARIVFNLVDNALKYRSRDRTAKIDVRASQKSDGIQITVADNGPGLTNDDRHRVFRKPFAKRKGHGSGVGLAISAKLAQHLGGELSYSRSGAGDDARSEFHLSFPKPSS